MSKSKRDRARKLFSAPQKSGQSPLNEQEAERRAIAEKTARLKALRLARDAAEATGGKSKVRAKPKAS
jgi:hypothetical protein